MTIVAGHFLAAPLYATILGVPSTDALTTPSGNIHVDLSTTWFRMLDTQCRA